jgi:hypothetical protein
VSDAAITFCILGAAVLVFVWDRLPVAVVAVSVALALWATGVLGYEQRRDEHDRRVAEAGQRLGGSRPCSCSSSPG